MLRYKNDVIIMKLLDYHFQIKQILKNQFTALDINMTLQNVIFSFYNSFTSFNITITFFEPSLNI